MEQDWSLIGETEEEAPISEDAAFRVRSSSGPGCLICAIEEWEDE